MSETKKDRNIITAEEFIKIWKGEYINDKKKSHYYFEQPIGYEGKRVEISNTEIIGKITVENVEELRSLRLINTKTEIFIIENSKTRNIEIRDSEIKQLAFKETANVRYVTVENSIISTGIMVWDYAVCNVMNIYKSFVNSILVEAVTAILNNLNIDSSTIQTLCVEDGAKIKSIYIKQSKTLLFRVCNNAQLEFIKIYDNSICIDFYIDSAKISERIDISKTQFINFHINTFILPKITISATSIENFDFNSTTSTTFILRNCEIVNFILLEVLTSKDGLIHLSDSQINRLEFNAVINLSSFNITNLKPLKNGSRPKYNRLAKLYEIENFNIDNSSICFINSDLGKMMISSDLSNFDEFIFYNSKIIDLFIEGTKLPIISSIKGKEDELETQKKIAYNQIKKIYQNRGDSITPIYYRMLELEAYRNEKNDEVTKKEKYEKLQLWFNYYTNKHDTNWLLALIILLFSSAVLYIIYCICIFGFDINGDWQLSIKLIPYYFEFINPVHKSDFLIDYSLKTITWQYGIALIFEFLGRIIIPLLTYQTIIAFRKYGRK